MGIVDLVGLPEFGEQKFYFKLLAVGIISGKLRLKKKENFINKCEIVRSEWKEVRIRDKEIPDELNTWETD